MTATEPLGPFCQSCSKPLDRAEDFGTDGSGHRINDYCLACYADGQFTRPDITLPEMTDRGVEMMVRHGIMPATDARRLLTRVLPELKRWRSAAEPAGAGRRGLSGGDEEC